MSNRIKLSSFLRNIGLLFIITVSLFFLSCTTYTQNVPIKEINVKKGYRFNTLKDNGNSDSLFIILAFSGGGTRAAALSYGVMEKLRETTIEWEGKRKSLLDEVDVISSVSGGSFTAAYYGLYRDRLFNKEDGFEKRFLYRNVQGKITSLLFYPHNLIRLASPTFGRIDMAEEFYDEEIFENKTFADLKEKGRPFIAINSTDMMTGTPFTFIQNQFDLICSDLSKFRVARAVAASSDFPVAFPPLQINNYADKCKYPKPIWMQVAEMDKDFIDNPRRNIRARKTWSYRNVKKRPFIHLLDGGLSDNIGLSDPLTALISNNHSYSIPKKINQRKIKKLVVIIVDAMTAPEENFELEQSPPGLIKVLSTATGVPMGSYTFSAIERVKDQFTRWQKDRRNLWSDPRNTFRHCPPSPDKMTEESLRPIDLYPIYVGFDQIGDNETHFGKNRDWYLNIPTSFKLPKDSVDKLRGVAGEILENSETFNALRDCLF